MKKCVLWLMIFLSLIVLSGCSDPFLEAVTDVQHSRIKTWEERCEYYLEHKDSESAAERQMAEMAKEEANKLATAYNYDMMRYGNMYGETLPEGLYGAIEQIP